MLMKITLGLLQLSGQNLDVKFMLPPLQLPCLEKNLKKKKIDISSYLKIVQLNSKINQGPFEIDFITLTHSIPEPNGLCIKTPSGIVLHSGDWKCDPNPLVGEKIDEKKLKEIGKQDVLAMICDSTNVISEGRAGSELDVRESLLKIISKLKKKNYSYFFRVKCSSYGNNFLLRKKD